MFLPYVTVVNISFLAGEVLIDDKVEGVRTGAREGQAHRGLVTHMEL